MRPSTRASGGPGERLPPERDLAGRYGCSLITVRRALADLAREERLERTRGRGTFVTAPRIVRELSSDPELRPGDGAARPRAAHDVAHGSAPARRRRCRRPLLIAAGAPTFLLERLRSAADRPLLLEQAHLSAERFPDLLTADFEHGSLYDFLAARYDCRIERLRETIEPVMPPAREAGLLGQSRRHAGPAPRRAPPSTTSTGRSSSAGPTCPAIDPSSSSSRPDVQSGGSDPCVAPSKAPRRSTASSWPLGRAREMNAAVRRSPWRKGAGREEFQAAHRARGDGGHPGRGVRRDDGHDAAQRRRVGRPGQLRPGHQPAVRGRRLDSTGNGSARRPGHDQVVLLPGHRRRSQPAAGRGQVVSDFNATHPNIHLVFEPPRLPRRPRRAVDRARLGQRPGHRRAGRASAAPRRSTASGSTSRRTSPRTTTT